MLVCTRTMSRRCNTPKIAIKIKKINKNKKH
jgi:hypothetical protein